MLEFFYDESEHSRKLTKETLLAENFREHFVASIIGILQSEKEKVEKEYSLFEEKYNLEMESIDKIWDYYLDDSEKESSNEEIDNEIEMEY